jgi:hypothetical protein
VLADTGVADLVITTGYLVAIIAVLRTAASAPARAERTGWLALGLALAALVLNQQADLHALAMRAVAARLEQGGLDAWAPVVTGTAALLLLAMIVGLCCLVATLRRRGVAKDPITLTGLALLAGYALGRTATFAHLMSGEWTQTRLAAMLKLAEGAGLAFVTVGAMRSRRQPADRSASEPSGAAA